jgi:hypothetical protein
LCMSVAVYSLTRLLLMFDRLIHRLSMTIPQKTQ